jgi:hypothetical protein
MITSNNKLYQYASSNMNSILIRYTDFKDPDENKTNADILDVSSITDYNRLPSKYNRPPLGPVLITGVLARLSFQN